MLSHIDILNYKSIKCDMENFLEIKEVDSFENLLSIYFAKTMKFSNCKK
jgi:hypothetical protein